jgi:hypothetical protein
MSSPQHSKPHLLLAPVCNFLQQLQRCFGVAFARTEKTLRQLVVTLEVEADRISQPRWRCKERRHRLHSESCKFGRSFGMDKARSSQSCHARQHQSPKTQALTVRHNVKARTSADARGEEKGAAI